MTVTIYITFYILNHYYKMIVITILLSPIDSDNKFCVIYSKLLLLNNGDNISMQIL